MALIVPGFLADLAADDTAIVVAIVAARLLAPLLIPRWIHIAQRDLTDTIAENPTVGVVLIVAANTAISMRFALSGRAGGERAAVRFGALVVANLALVVLGHFLLSGDAFQLGTGLFFAGLITLILWLFDVYRPIYDARFDRSSLGVTSVADFAQRVRAASP
jgi:hypothetical protein